VDFEFFRDLEKGHKSKLASRLASLRHENPANRSI
jgi:hypothetical protein